MSLLIDEIHKPGRWVPSVRPDIYWTIDDWDDWQRQVALSLKNVPVFEVSNVAEYFYGGTGQEIWDWYKDFPRPMPPFSQTWFEWKLPKESLKGSEVVKLSPASVFDRVGALISVDLAPPIPPSAAGLQSDRIRYRFNVAMFARGYDRRIHVMAVIVFGLTEGFKPLGLTGDERVIYFFPGADMRRTAEFAEELNLLGSETCSLSYPAALALSMLNCKNVTTRTVHLPAALAKKHARKGHHVTLSHNVIEIQPVTELIKRETGQAGYSRGAAAVIRGHFKDYSRGKGLFGKIKGQFWWSQQLNAALVPEYRLAAATGELDERWPENLDRAKP